MSSPRREHADNATHFLREVSRVDRAMQELGGRVENAMRVNAEQLAGLDDRLSALERGAMERRMQELRSPPSADAIERRMQAFDQQLESLPRALEKDVQMQCARAIATAARSAQEKIEEYENPEETLRLSAADAAMAEKMKDLLAQVDDAAAEQKRALEAVEASLRSELSRLSSEHQAGQGDRTRIVSVEGPDVQMREEMRARGEDHKAVVEGITDQMRRDIEKVAIENVAAHDASRSKSREALAELEARLRAELGDRGDDLAALEAKLREEIQGMHTRLDEVHRANSDAIEVKLKDQIGIVSKQMQEEHDSLKSLVSNHKEEIDAAHGRTHDDHRAALEALEAMLKEEIDGKQGHLDEVHRGALEAIDVKLQDEISRVSSEHQAGHNALTSLLANHKDEIKAVHDDHRTALELLEARLREEVGGKHGQLDQAHGAALEAIDVKFKDEISRVSSEHQDGHKTLKSMFAEHKDEMKGRHDGNKAVLEATEAKLRAEIDGKHGQLGEVHRAALEAIDAKLQHEISRVSSDHQDGHDAFTRRFAEHKDGLQGIHDGYRATLEVMEAKLQEEMNGKHGQLDETHRAALAAIDVKMQNEISRLSGEHQEGHDILKTLLTQNKEERDSFYSQKHDEHRVALEVVEAKLREEIDGKHGQIGEVHRAGMEAIDVKFKDEIGRVSSEHQDGHNVLKSMLAEHKDVMQRAHDGHSAELQAVDIKFQDEIRRVSSQHQEGQDALKCFLEEHKAEVSGANVQNMEQHQALIEVLEGSLREEIGGIAREQREGRDELHKAHDEHTKVLASLHSKLEEEIGKRGHFDENLSAALDAVDVKIKDEIQRSSCTYGSSLAQQVAELRQTYDHKFSQVYASQEQALEVVEVALKQDISRLTNSHQEGSTMLRTLLAEHKEELQNAVDQRRQADSAAVQALGAELRQEISSTCGNLDAANRSALTAMDARLSDEMGRFANEQKKGSVAVSDLLVQQQSGLEIASAKKHAEMKAVLQDLEARFREEIAGRQVKMDSTHKAALQTIEAKLKDDIATLVLDQKKSSSALKEAMTELKGDTNAKHEKKLKEGRQALDALEAKLTEELDIRQSRLNGAQKAAIEEMQTGLRDEISRLGIDNKKVQAGTKESIEDHKDEMDRIHARRQAEQKQAFDELDVRIMDAVSSKHGKFDAATRAALQALDEELRAEFSGLSAEQRKGQAMLKELVEVQTSELDDSQSRLTALNKAAIEGVDAKLQDVAAKCAKIESSQRSGLQALNVELREEIVRPEKRQAAAQRAAIEDVDSRFRTELLEYTSRLESQLRAAMRTGEEQLRAEIGVTRTELESQRIKLASEQGSLQALLHETDARLRGECPRDTSVDLLLADPDGREWTFNSSQEFLEEVAQRLQQLQGAVLSERSLREDQERRLFGEIRQLEARGHAFQDASQNARAAVDDPKAIYDQEKASLEESMRRTLVTRVHSSLQPAASRDHRVAVEPVMAADSLASTVKPVPSSWQRPAPTDPASTRQSTGPLEPVVAMPPFVRGPGSLIPAGAGSKAGPTSGPPGPASARSTAPGSASTLSVQSRNSSRRLGSLGTTAAGSSTASPSPIVVSARGIPGEPKEQLRTWQR